MGISDWFQEKKLGLMQKMLESKGKDVYEKMGLSPAEAEKMEAMMKNIMSNPQAMEEMKKMMSDKNKMAEAEKMMANGDEKEMVKKMKEMLKK
jgi:hypothetical protein